MWRSLSRGRGFPEPSWASLGAVQDKWAAWWQRSETSRSQVSNPTFKVYTWHSPVKLSVGMLWYHPLLTFGSWSTDALNNLIEHTGKTYRGPRNCAHFRYLCPVLYRKNNALLRTVFPRSCTLCCFYCNELGLEIDFSSASLMSAKGKPCTRIGEVKKWECLTRELE